jgi:hypothetical protein
VKQVQDQSLERFAALTPGPARPRPNADRQLSRTKEKPPPPERGPLVQAQDVTVLAFPKRLKGGVGPESHEHYNGRQAYRCKHAKDRKFIVHCEKRSAKHCSF